MVQPPFAAPSEMASERDVLLATKLHVPRPRPDLVPRPRLAERLDEGLARGLMLVCAPAGYGKTILLADWARRGQQPVAWVSLDVGDNDPARFWRHGVAALDEARPGLAGRVGPFLGPPAPSSYEGLVTALINELAAGPDAGQSLLVLDDYHLIDSAAVHESFGFLIEHRPPGLRLVLASRSDPPLVLARLRGRGQLAELRAAELRFTPDEAAALLRQGVAMSGVGLPETAVAALATRTEGWAAGLQLAALSLRGQPDAAGFTAAFTGSHRYVLDFLAEEVLEHQSEKVRTFLLETSVLERLSGPLCDAVTGRPGSQALLEEAERAGFRAAPWFCPPPAGGTGGASGDEAQLTGPGDGLGAVGRAELAQHVAHVLLDGVQGDHQFAGDGLVRPARRHHFQHLELAAGQWLNDAGGARIRRGRSGGEGPLEPGQVAEGDAGGRPAGALGRDEPAEQRGHRRALVGEDPYVALRAGQQERPGEGGDRACLLAGGGQGQCPQRAGLDQAAGTVPGFRRRVQPVQQREGLAGPVLGEQHPGQHQVPGFARVVRLVVRAEAVVLRESGRRGQVALGQQQPGPLGGDRVEQAGRTWCGLAGLGDRLQRPGRIAGGLPDPRQRGQAAGQRGGVDELAAQRDALGRVPQGDAEFVPLVGNPGQPRIARAGGCAAGRT